MTKLLTVAVLLAILVAAVNAVQQLPAVVEYAALYDAGREPETFTTLAGLEGAHTAWIRECRGMWLERVR